MRRLRALLIVLICTLASAAFAQLPLLDTLSRDPTDDQAYGELPWDSLDKTSFPPACSPGYCIMGFDTVSGMFDCGPCSSGSGGTECSTSPCDLDAATTQDGKGICLEDWTNCPPTATPVLTATPYTTPTPILTTTPYPTPTVTATSTWNSPTPTATPTQTQTPEVCFTDSMGRGGLIGAHPGKCGSPIATVTPTPTETTTPTPQLTAAAAPTVCQTVCTGIGCIGGLRADNPPICNAIVATLTPTASPTPTIVGTPLPVKDATGAAGSQPAYASFDHEHAISRIDTVPSGGTPALTIRPLSAPGVGQRALSVARASGGDPILDIFDLADDGLSRAITVRLDNGTVSAGVPTSSQKPWQTYYGIAGDPVHLFTGATTQVLNSQVVFDDVDLELGNIQSYIVVDPSNVNRFFSSGIASNLEYQGTGGDATLAPNLASGSAFSSFTYLRETGNGLHRTAAGTQSQVLIDSDGGTTATAEYWGIWIREGGTPSCTYPNGTCIDLLSEGGLYIPELTFAPTTGRFSIKSIGQTTHMEHAGAIYAGGATPTPTPTATNATPTSTTTATPVPTATSTSFATATATGSTPTPTAIPQATPQPGFVEMDDTVLYGNTFGAPQILFWSDGQAPATNAPRFYGGGGPNAFCQPVAKPMPRAGCMTRLVCATNSAPWPGSYTVKFQRLVGGTNLVPVQDDETCILSGINNPATCLIDYAADGWCWQAGDRVCLRVDPSAIAPASVNLNCVGEHRNW